MRRFSLRMDYLFERESLEDQIRLAAETGIDALEMGNMTGYDCKKAAELSARYGVPFYAIGFYDILDTRVGKPWAKIREAFLRTVECAKTLNVKQLLAMGPDVSDRGEAARQTFLENIRPAVEVCEDNDMTLLIEPHSTKYPNPFGDFSKYLINTSEIGFELVSRIDSPKVKLLFDCYHVQTMEGDLLMKIRKNLDLIGHVHVAGTPERNEPWSGEINYSNLAAEMESLGYTGFFGLEYYPADNSRETIRRVLEYLAG